MLGSWAKQNLVSSEPPVLRAGDPGSLGRVSEQETTSRAGSGGGVLGPLEPFGEGA